MTNTDMERICGIVSEVTGISVDALAGDPAACTDEIHSLDLTEIILEVEEMLDVILEEEEEITNVADLIRQLKTQTA